MHYKWINIKEDLPFYNRSILCFTKAGTYVSGFLEKLEEYRYFICSDTDEMIPDVVAWAYAIKDER